MEGNSEVITTNNIRCQIVNILLTTHQPCNIWMTTDCQLKHWNATYKESEIEKEFQRSGLTTSKKMPGIWDLRQTTDATKDRVKWKHYVTISSSAAGWYQDERTRRYETFANVFTQCALQLNNYIVTQYFHILLTNGQLQRKFAVPSCSAYFDRRNPVPCGRHGFADNEFELSRRSEMSDWPDMLSCLAAIQSSACNNSDEWVVGLLCSWEFLHHHQHFHSTW